MLRARLAAGAAVVVLATTIVGCGSDGDDSKIGQAPPVGSHATALVTELDRIRSTDASRAWTAYGDLARQRALGGGTTPARLAGLSAYGWSTTWQYDARARRRLGLSGGTAERVAEVGEEHGAGRFDGGVDTAAVVAEARELGARKDGTVGTLTLWRLAPDDAVHASRALDELSRGTADFDVLAVDEHTLVRARSRAQARVLSAVPGERTLARDADVRAVAECLGNPLAATFTDAHRAPAAASHEPAGFFTGAGVTGTDADRLTQVACRTTASPDEAEQVAAAVRHELDHGRTRLSRVPWRNMLSDGKVQVLDGPGHVVRITATSRKSPQLVLEMMRSGDLSDLLDVTD